MTLPTRNSVETLDLSLEAQPAVVIEAKSLSSGTLDYSLYAQPVYGLPSGAPIVVQNSAFLIFFNGP